MRGLKCCIVHTGSIVLLTFQATRQFTNQETVLEEEVLTTASPAFDQAVCTTSTRTIQVSLRVRLIAGNNHVLKISINVTAVDFILTLVSSPNKACKYVKLPSHHYHPVSSNQVAVLVTE